MSYRHNCLVLQTQFSCLYCKIAFKCEGVTEPRRVSSFLNGCQRNKEKNWSFWKHEKISFWKSFFFKGMKQEDTQVGFLSKHDEKHRSVSIHLRKGI